MERRGYSERVGDIPVIAVGDRSVQGVSLGAVACEYEYDKQENLARYERIIEIAAAQGVDLLVFPEWALTAGVWNAPGAWELPADALSFQYENAETIPGPTTEHLTRLAAHHEMLLAVHMTERLDHYGKGKGGLFSAAVLIAPEGVLHVYRKVHIAGPERAIYRTGREIGATDTALGRIALSICYDILFPEAARVAAVDGADILLFQTAWDQSFDPALLGHVPAFAGSSNYSLSALLGVRAFENQMWIVAASTAGADPKAGLTYWGEAKVIGPDGITKVQTPLGEQGIAIAHGCAIDDEIIRSRTATYWGDSFMFDRKPSVYGPLADEDRMYP